jgi:hypothetical protein
MGGRVEAHNKDGAVFTLHFQAVGDQDAGTL